MDIDILCAGCETRKRNDEIFNLCMYLPENHQGKTRLEGSCLYSNGLFSYSLRKNGYTCKSGALRRISVERRAVS